MITVFMRGVSSRSELGERMVGTSREKRWYREVKSLDLPCPYCSYEAALSLFIPKGDRPVTYEGFSFGTCPRCKNVTIFDYERKSLTRIGEGRKPFPILIGMGRVVNLLLLSVGLYLLITGQLFWLPLLYVISVISEISWELVLKRENPDWYWSDPTFKSVTDRIAYLGIPLTVLRAAFITASVYYLWLRH